MTSPAAFLGKRILKTHCKNGHEFTPENTAIRPFGRRCRICNNKSRADLKRRTRAIKTSAPKTVKIRPYVDADLFWSKVDKSGDCWIWLASKDPDGYGFATFSGKSRRAHRVAYILEKGDIPDGMMICHSCDNPSCVNPTHLRPGTNMDNVQDMMQRKRHHNQAKTHCKRGHEFTIENTRLSAKGRICKACSALDAIKANIKKKEARREAANTALNNATLS